MATVKIKYRDKEYEVNAGMTVRDAIKKIGLTPEAVLAVCNGKLMTDDTIIEPEMKIKLVAVVSGGTSPPASPPPLLSAPFDYASRFHSGCALRRGGRGVRS